MGFPHRRADGFSGRRIPDACRFILRSRDNACAVGAELGHPDLIIVLQRRNQLPPRPCIPDARCMVLGGGDDFTSIGAVGRKKDSIGVAAQEKTAVCAKLREQLEGQGCRRIIFRLEA